MPDRYMKIHKKAWFPWIVLIILLLGIQGCQIDPCGSAPADLIENMKDLVREVKKKDYKPKDDRWQVYDDRFQIYFEDCYDRWSPEMTSHQKKQFTGLTGQFLANRFGRSFFKSIFGNKKDDEKDIDEIPESLKKLGEDVQKFLEDQKESGKEILENLLNEASDWWNTETKNK